MIKKIYRTVICLSFGLIGFSLNAQEMMPELKPSAIIDDTVITLDDIFTDLAEKNDLIVANAPEPGKKALISARHILKITRANNVRWNNSAGVKNVIVTRLSTIVTVPELKDKLIEELKGLYQSDKSLDIRFYNRNVKIHLPNGYDVADLSIKNINLDRKNDKFSALIAAPTGLGSEKLYTVNGRTLKVTEIPSLNRTIRNGEIINTSDIKWTPIPDAQVGRNVIRSSNKLVGMTPRTQIKEGKSIRLSEVSRPMLVKRGALVKIRFNTSKISLSTIGKAMQNGGKGDVIQVKNNASNKIISAVVLGENQVQVSTAISSFVLLN